MPSTISFGFDLHAQILSSLASTLAKDPTTSVDDVQRLVRTGPALPLTSQPSSPKPSANGSENSSSSAENVLVDGGFMVSG